MTDNKKKEIREKIRKIGKTVIMENDGSYSYAEDLDTNQIDQLTALCESIRAEALKDLIEEEYGNDLITSIDYYNIGKLVLAKLSKEKNET